MKTLIVTALAVLAVVAALAVVPFSAMAQQDSAESTTTCISLKALTELIRKFEEKPAMAMKSYRTIKGEQVVHGTVLFINYETRSWTLVERTHKDRYCVVAMGQDISPIPAE